VGSHRAADDHWLTPDTGQHMSMTDLEKRNDLFQNEDQATYIGKLNAKLSA
jgi:hypothetical protein